MRVVTGLHQIEAEAAAGRLRAAGIDAQVLRDNEALLGVAGSTSLGTFSVSIADSDEEEARRLLHVRRARVVATKDDDGPFSASAIFLIVLALLVGLVVVYIWSLSGSG